MPVERIHIDRFLELSKHHPLMDVRSPGEYSHAHIPGAHSLPLFTDEERTAVGKAYKQESREAAIKIGLDFFGPKMKTVVEAAEKIFDLQLQLADLNKNKSATEDLNRKTALLYCWRGGMRSAAIAWLLDLYGFKVYTLAGGYKKFRNHVLDVFRLPFRFKILGGYTGSGKTEVLKELKRKGEAVIDLEDIARHKGSAFGNIGMPKQPTQEMFENLLSCELRAISYKQEENSDLSFVIHYSPTWLEDESQRIGLVNLPNDLWNTMRNSPVYFMDIPFEERLKHVAEEYGGLDRDKMIDAIGRIKERLGGLEAKNAMRLLEEGNTAESFRILLKYYDKWYYKALHNREGLNSLLHTITCESVTPLNAKKLIREPQYHEKP